MPQHRTAALAATALVVTLGLTGCFANPLEQLAETGIENGVESLIENQTGADVDVSTDGSGASLPDSFPGEVPVVDGKIISSLAIEDSWLLTITPDSLADAEAGYQDLLDAGFTEVAAMDLGENNVINTVENETYSVAYSWVTDSDGVTSVNLTVTTKEQ